MRGLLAILMLCPALLSGCSEPARPLFVPGRAGLVWPPQPDQPRIGHLGQLSSSEDLGARKSSSQFWHELLYGPTEPARLVTPHAVAVHADGGRVAVADTNGKCVHLFDLDRRKYTRYERCAPSGRLFECPVGIAWAGETLYVADAVLHAVALLPPSGPERLFGAEHLKRPAGLAYSRAHDLLYVTDSGEHAVWAFHPDGRLAFRFGSKGTGPGQFNFPSHVACDADGTVVVADSLNFRVQRFASDGTPLGQFGQKGDAPGDFGLPKGVAISPEGYLWVVDAHFENIQGFTPQGELLLAFGAEGRGPGQFWLPAGICVDARRRMWVADTYNRRVQVFELFE